MYRIIFRPTSGEGVDEAIVPHLNPFARLLERGQDGTVRLPDRRVVRLSELVSVAQLDASGQVTGAWEVRRAGLDGRHDWRLAWRDVAALTAGLTPEQPAWGPVWEAVDALEAAWRARDAVAWALARAGLVRVRQGAMPTRQAEVA